MPAAGLSSHQRKFSIWAATVFAVMNAANVLHLARGPLILMVWGLAGISAPARQP